MARLAPNNVGIDGIVARVQAVKPGKQAPGRGMSEGMDKLREFEGGTGMCCGNTGALFSFCL